MTVAGRAVPGSPGGFYIAILFSLIFVLSLLFATPKPDGVHMHDTGVVSEQRFEAVMPLADSSDCAAYDHDLESTQNSCCDAACSPPPFVAPPHVQIANLDRSYFPPAGHFPPERPNSPLQEPPKAVPIAL